MIPLVSILNMVSALIFIGISLKLYFSYKKSGDQTLSYFWKAFFFYTAVLVALGLPGLILITPVSIGVALNIHPIFGFLALAFLVSVPLKLMGYETARKIIFGALVFFGALFVFLSFLNWKDPVTFFQEGQFVYWEDARGVLVNILLGIFYGLSVLMTIVFFLIQGLRSSDKFVRIRSLIISAGLLCIFLAVAFNFILGASAQVYITSIIATVFNILAAALVMAGIYYKKKEQITYKADKDYPRIQW